VHYFYEGMWDVDCKYKYKHRFRPRDNNSPISISGTKSVDESGSGMVELHSLASVSISHASEH